MVIGIIGASLSALVAGVKLAKAGHDVTVIEKDRRLGGRLASYHQEGIDFDYGVSSIIASDPEFKSFLNELRSNDIIKEWARDFAFFDGVHFHEVNPNRPQNMYHSANGGLSSIATYLSRWVDVKSQEKAGGLTHIGADRTKKRSWMINLTDISVFECDAVILAAPAPQSYGVLQTTQDETPTRKIIRYIDEVSYKPCFSLMALYPSKAMPAWRGVECKDHTLSWIGNESSKLENPSKTGLTIRSSAEFAHKYQHAGEEEIKNALLERASDIAGISFIHPEWTKLHYWKYYETINPINEFFLELEMEEAPLALIGDYLGGNSVQDAYLSGYNLAEYWIGKYSKVTV